MLEKAKGLDWGFALVLALGLFAASPFLLRAGLPRNTDAELHVYRAAELGHALRGGVLYPRWAPNLYLGYGYPIFHYYAPLTYYLSNFFALAFPAVGIVGGVKTVFIVGLLVASAGTYLLARGLFGRAAALLAAASFAFSPYVLFIDPHARGALAEHFAICLSPIAFFFLHQLMRSPTRGRLLGFVFSLAGVVFSHNLTGLVMGALMGVYWLWQVSFGGRPRQAAWVPVAFLLAAALIAFFWLPALLETHAVKLDVIGPGHFDFREHFLTVRELLAPSRLIDWGATGPRFRYNLGVAQWILALPGLAAIVKGLKNPSERHVSRDTAFFAGAGVILMTLTIRPSSIVWESLPVMAYLQFPWRLLGALNLMLALCAAAGATLLTRHPARSIVITAGVGLIVLTALPLLNPSPWPGDFVGTAPADIIEWERQSQALGTTSTGDFLPVTVDMIPEATDSLIHSYTEDGPVDKVNRATLPEGAEVRVLENKPNRGRFWVTAPSEFILRLYTFHFPGWRAYVDGERVAIEIARPEGFITVQVPEGTHEVVVRFEDTLPRQMGWMISAGAVIALGAVLATWSPVRNTDQPAPRLHCLPLTWLQVTGVLALIVSTKVVVLDPYGLLHHHSRPGEALPAQQHLGANFADKIELIAYDLPETQLAPGDVLPVVLYWRALNDLEENYQSFVHVAQPLDVAWTQEDHLNPGGLPTSRWPMDKYVWDEYGIQIPHGMPPGEYMVNVGLYLRSDGTRLQRQDAGHIGDDGSVIGFVKVSAARDQQRGQEASP